MTTCWNFRQILNVYPESKSFTCVAAKGDESTRCANRRPLLSDLNLDEASRILDTMDNCESLRASYDYLLDLAHLTLCIEHSESGLSQISQISGRWQDKIIMHMKKEVANTARPKTRRDFGRMRRGPSQSLMTVLIETKEEQALSPTINVPSLNTNKKGSKLPRPTRSVSTRISSLITEVGFQDASNSEYKPTTTLPRAKTTSTESAQRFFKKNTPIQPASTEDDEWTTEQLITLLDKPNSGSATDDVPTPTSARGRSGTTSSTGSSSSKASKSSKFTESLDGSSPPTSRDSSAKSSPIIGSYKDAQTFREEGMPRRRRSPPKIKIAVPSPERPLPTFDFGIFTNLPLPPGHKEELSPEESKVPSQWESQYKMPRLPIPPKKYNFNSSATGPEQLMEKPLPKIAKPVKTPSVRHMRKTPVVNKELQQHSRTASDDSGIGMSTVAEKTRAAIAAAQTMQASSAQIENALLPEQDLVEPIGTSWIDLVRTPSRKSSVKLARRPSRLSRTLSRTMSRSSSTRSKASNISKEGSLEHSPERVKILRRQTDGLTRQPSVKRESLPLHTLIKMSHELADRLDGIETSGFVEVRPSSSYKYHLPRNNTKSTTPPVPDLRWSKLFTSVEPEEFLNESPFFRVHAKPVPRSNSIGGTNATEELRLQHPGEECTLPLSEMKIKAVQEEWPRLQTEKPNALGQVDVCSVCGNTQGIWGRCGCMENRRRSNGSGSIVLVPMEQIPPVPRGSTLRRIRKRGMTLRRIRTRVVRALTV